MNTPKLPEINLTPAKPREGELLELPHDWTPVPDLQLDTLNRAATVQDLLREEEDRACEAGMTVEELRHYQDLLLKNSNMAKIIHTPTEECRAWAAMFDITVIEPNNGSELVPLARRRHSHH